MIRAMPPMSVRIICIVRLFPPHVRSTRSSFPLHFLSCMILSTALCCCGRISSVVHVRDDALFLTARRSTSGEMPAEDSMLLALETKSSSQPPSVGSTSTNSATSFASSSHFQTCSASLSASARRANCTAIVSRNATLAGQSSGLNSLMRVITLGGSIFVLVRSGKGRHKFWCGMQQVIGKMHFIYYVHAVTKTAKKWPHGLRSGR